MLVYCANITNADRPGHDKRPEGLRYEGISFNPIESLAIHAGGVLKGLKVIVPYPKTGDGQPIGERKVGRVFECEDLICA